MKLVDDLKSILIGNNYTVQELDGMMAGNDYYLAENMENTLKYSNGKSEVWIVCSSENGLYAPQNVTYCVKKRGKTRVQAFRNLDDIKAMMDYFRGNEYYDHFLTFTIGLLLGRRVGDTLNLKWNYFYYPNGRRKNYIRNLEEEKTGKIVDIKVSDAAWGYIDEYLQATGINPKDNINGDIFVTEYKEAIYSKRKELSPQEYEKELDKAKEKQAAAYRYVFKKAADANGIENVSTHSTRKSFGYWSHKLNPQDVDNLDVLQTIFGHSDKETTKIYIDSIPEKAERIFDQIGEFINDVDNGNKPVIDNAPAIALKTSDLRDLLIIAYESGNKGEDKADCLNRLYSLAESVTV